MSSVIEGYNYDIFISYRQKDNKGEKWVSEFVEALKTELESTFKDEISVYFDINPHDGLLETHDVEESLKEKLKCLIFIPIISRTYCDPRSFAWEHELKAFVEQTSKDQYGLKVKLPNGNVASRVLPARIHDLDFRDNQECESVFGGPLRGVEFIYKSQGVNRPLTPTDKPEKNLNNTFYRDQINKIALAIKDLVQGMKFSALDETGQETLFKEDFEITEISEERKAAAVIKHNLPAQLTKFIGREKEITIIRQLLSENRLVTLTGTGGCGKTRLAIQSVAELLDEYPDGIWMVELAPITVPDHIDHAIAEIFMIKEQPSSSLIHLITHYLKNKNLLLLFDNCEHLISACSEIAEQILRSTENITILSTSRESLNVADEKAWRVPSLSLPENGKDLSAAELNHYEAVQLFVTRAKSKQQEFVLSDQNAQSVLQICKRLDGIPLAIELAASRVNVFNPEIIVSKLDDRFRLLTGGSRTALERHKTLQATIDWSYDLLPDHEKEIFHLLSVFVSGFDLEAYESICCAVKENRDDLMDLLTGLIEKSLVITRTTKDDGYRYQLLETIRHYAKEKLLESGKSEAARESHFQYYYRLAEKAYLENIERYEYWIDRLEVEHENMIVALEWSNNDPERRLQLAGVLGWFWADHSHFRLGLDYLMDLEDIPDEKILTKARAMTSIGWLSLYVGRPEGVAISEKSVELWNRLNNTREKVQALYYYSIIKSIFQDFKTAEDVATEMKKIAVELKDDYLLLWARTAQTYIYIYQLKVDLAEPLAEQSLKDAIALDESYMKGANLHYYSDCALMRKDYKETEKRYSIAMKYQLEIGNHYQSLNELTGMIYGLSGQGRYKKALLLLGAVYAKFDEYGVSLPQILKFWMDWFEEYVNGARRSVGEEKAKRYEQEGRQIGYEMAIKYALDFDKD